MIPDLRLFGIHSTKSSAFFVFNFSILSSTSCVLRSPRKVKFAAIYFPSSGLTLEKKWRRGKGTKFTPSFRRSPFNLPGNRREQVIPQ